jgi:DNA-binding GntR family transcriptional regulator
VDILQMAEPSQLSQSAARVQGDLQSPLNGVEEIQQRTNLKDEISRAIRNQILSGQLSPGARIDQDELARRFAVSRIPVREAIIALAAEGLVVNIPRRGSYAAEFSPDDVRDQFEIYGMVAGLACARAARNRTDSDAARLFDLADKLSAARSEASTYEQLSFEFHQAVAHAAKSARITTTLKTLFRSMPTQFFGTSSSWIELAEKYHHPIADAIERQGEQVAEALMREYLFAWSALLTNRSWSSSESDGQISP